MNDFNDEIAALETLLSKGLDQVQAVKKVARNGQPKHSELDTGIKKLDDAELALRAEQLLKWSRLKAEYLNLGTGLFSDSCWDMCLDIYICDLKNEQITVSSVAHSSGIPMTTAMRYINVMAEEGLLEKTSNPSDNRMVFVSTSQSCKERISDVLQKLP